MSSALPIHDRPMRAVILTGYGSPDRLSLQTINQPKPNDDQVLLEVRAAAINPYDMHVMRGKPYLLRSVEGWRKPKTSVIGVDVAGVVVSVGKKVTQFKRGDEVFGGCNGSLAEYGLARPTSLVIKPQSISFAEAASFPTGGFTALQGLRDVGQVQPGQHVLINGASGGVGTMAVQIAKSMGAHVTGVCSTGNVELVRSLGADEVIDYKRENFTGMVQKYDLILDLVTNRSLIDCRRALKARGTLVIIGAPKGQWLAPVVRPLLSNLYSRFVSQRLMFMLAKRKHDDLVTLTELVENGNIKPIIDRTYPLAEAADAMRYLETGRARGKVVISI